MFEGWATDLLASYLGKLLDIQQEQLKVNLWTAWKTGVTLEDVPLREDVALDQFGTTPFTLVGGTIGKVQVSVPWGALMAPVVVSLNDVSIVVRMLGDDELSGRKAYERYIDFKKGLIASQQLKAVAWEVDKASPSSSKDGSPLMFSFLKHALSLLLGRLRVDIRNVRITLVDGEEGSAPICTFSVGQIQSIDTPLTFKLDKKDAYRIPGRDDTIIDLADGLLKLGTSKNFRFSGIKVVWGAASCLLHTDFNAKIFYDIKSTPSQILFTLEFDTLKSHVNTDELQAMVNLMEDVEWKSVRLKVGHLKPQDGAFDASSRWKFAVNSILLQLYGPLKFSSWKSPKERLQERRRYILLYRKKIEREVREGLAKGDLTGSSDVAVSQSLSLVGENQLALLEESMSVSDILACRTAAKRSLDHRATHQAGKSSNSTKIGNYELLDNFSREDTSESCWVKIPSLADMEELFKAVDFSPDERVAEQSSSGLNIQMLLMVHVPTSQVEICNNTGTVDMCVRLANIACGFVSSLGKASYCMGSLESMSCSSPNGSFVNSVVNDSLSFVKLEYSSLTKCIQADISGIQIKAVPQDIHSIFHSIPVQSPEAYSLQWMRSALSMEKIGYCVETVQRIKSLGNFIDFAVQLGEMSVEVHDLQMSFSSLTLGTLMESENFDELHRVYNVISSLRPQEEASRVVQDAMQALEHRLIYKALDIQVESLAVHHHEFMVLNPVSFGVSTKMNRLLGDFSHPQVILGISFTSIDLQANDEVIRALMYIADEFTQTNDNFHRENVPEETLEVRVDWSAMKVGWFDDNKQFSVRTEAGMVSSQTSMSTSVFQTKINSIEMEHLTGIGNIEMPVFNLCIPYIAKVLQIGYFTGTNEKSKMSRSASFELYDFSLTGDGSDPSNFIKRLGPERKTPGVAVTYTEDADGRSCVRGELSNIDVGHGVILRASLLPLVLSANTNSKAPEADKQGKAHPVSFQISLYNVSLAFVHDSERNVGNLPIEYLDFSSVKPRVASCSISRLQLGITLSEKPSVDSFEMEALKLRCGILSSRGPLLTPILDIPVVDYCLQNNNVLVVKCRQIEVGIHPYQLTLLRALALRWECQKESLAQSYVSKQESFADSADTSLALQQMDFSPVEVQIQDVGVSLLGLPSLNGGILLVGQSCSARIEAKSLRFSWNRLEILFKESLMAQVDPCGSDDGSRSMSVSNSPSQTDFSHSSDLDNHTEFYDVSRNASSASFVSKYYSIGDDETISVSSLSLVEEGDSASTLNGESLTSVVTIAFDDENQEQKGVEASLSGKSAKVSISPIHIVFCIDPIPSIVHFVEAYGNYLSTHVCIEDDHQSSIVSPETAPVVRDLEIELRCVCLMMETKHRRDSIDEQFSSSIDSREDLSCCTSQAAKDFISVRLNKGLCSYSSGNAGQKISLQVLGILFGGDSCSEAKQKTNWQSSAVVGVQNLNIQCSILHKNKEAQAFKSDVACDQISVWINQMNIPPVQHVILRLRDCMNGARATSNSNSGSQMTQSWSSNMINSTIMMSSGRFSIVLASSIADEQVYLMEGNLKDISVMAYFVNGVAHGSASCSIGVAVPIVQYGVWANVLDDTVVKLQAISPHLGHTSNPSPASKIAHLDLDVGSANLTITSDILHSITLCEAFVASLITSQNQIDFKVHLGMDWIINRTEFDMLLCFPGDNEACSHAGAIVLEPGAKYYPSQISTQPYKSGLPDTEEGISERGEPKNILRCPSPDFMDVKLSGSDSRYCRIDLQRDGCSRHTYTVEGQSLAVISKTERLPSGAQRTSLEPSIEFQNNTGFRITLRYISDNSPGYPLISVVPQNAKLWLPLSAVSGEYRFRIDTQESMLNETEWIDDISPIGLSEPLLLWDSMFQTEYLDHLDIISDHGNAQFCMSLTINGISGSISFIASPKVLFQNLLPVPMTVISENLCTRLCASPTETLMLADVHHLPWNFRISPVGFNESSLLCLSDVEGTSRISCTGDPEQTSMLSITFSDSSSGNTELFAQLITHRSSDTGTVLLKIVAPIWVYNYTGLPISLSCLLSSEVVSEIDKWEESGDGEITDIVPESWILPLQISVDSELISVRSVPSSLHMSLSEPSICETEQGEHGQLDHMPGRQRECTEQNVSEASNDILLGLGYLAHDAEGVEDASLIHRPHGQASAVDSPSGRMPKAHSTWPSGLNQFAVSFLKQPMKRIRIRSSKQKALSGSTFWSSPLFLGGLHDRHEIVQIPMPFSTGGISKDNFRPGEYPAVVSLKVLEEGVEEIIISPQFVIINQLTSSIQYRQKGTNAEVKIKPGEYSPVQWADSGLPRKLSVRILEAGWLWSGGFSLEHAGDIFLKLRHRDRGITRIVRADVSHSLKDGTRRIIFRSNPEEFTPYRIENCSLETLIIRQKGVMDQQDVLRPYCSLDYTWDEPSLSHFVVIERPGGLFLGSIDLDRVGLKLQVNVKDKMSDKKVKLSISVHSEGPMRVLRVMDEKYHQSVSHNGNDLIHLDGGMNNTFHLKCSFSSVFVSYVQKREEKLLLAIRYFALSCLTSPSRISISGSIDLMQVDNPRIKSVFPVVLVLPAPESSLTSRVRKGIEPQNVQKPLAWNLILWRKKPQNKVVCFELAEIHLQSLGIYIEQDILNLFENISSELESLQRLKSTHSKGLQTRNGQISSLDLSTLEFSKTKQYRDEKYYFDRIIISPVEVRLSFNSSLVQDSSKAFLQQVIALADIEDARLWLAGVILKNALLDEITMQSFLSSHYRRALLLELFKIVGAANVLGDPMALLHHVGLGVWEFFSGPAVGLIESAKTFGPREFIFGFISGTKGLLQNFLFAASNATTKASSAAHKAILLWGFGKDGCRNDLPMNTAMQHWVRVDEYLPDEEGLIGALLRGLVGLATDPIKGAEEGGLLGFVDGIFHGLLGTILIPLSAWLQMCASTARSVRKAVAGTANLSWTRPPRWIDLPNALEPYSRTESMGRWLFVQLCMLQNWRKKIENDSFVVCCRLYNAEKSDESYLLLTDRRVLVVTAKGNNWNPLVLWTSRLGAIESIQSDQKSVLIIANPELVKSSMLRMHEDQGKLFSVFIARLETESESQKFSAKLTYECSKYLQGYYSNRIGFNI